jgi:accessory Sec system S-layer assembly protein
LLSFLKRNKDEEIKKQGKDSSISSLDLVNEVENAAEEEVTTELSFHPMANVPAEQQYVYRFLNNELDPLKPNQISLAGIDLKEEHEGVLVTAFVRNSLSKGIKLGMTNLILLGPNGDVLARKAFDLSELGEIPAKSSRPWTFAFEKNLLTTSEVPNKDWKIAFELKQKHQLDLEDSWKEALSYKDKQKLQILVEGLPELNEGEINFAGIKAQLTEQKDLHVTLLIRNGRKENVHLQQIPLEIVDATGETVAKGGFTLTDFEVKANTSKPWTFIFPCSMVTKENPDLSKWKAIPIQNK